MHDPMTVAFEIKRPWPEPPSKLFPKTRRYWPSLVTVWHVDPQLDGSDDSCGFSYARVPKADRAWAEQEAAREWESWFAPKWASVNLANADVLEIVVAAVAAVRWRISRRRSWKGIGARDLSRAVMLVSNPNDNIRSMADQARRSPGDFADLLGCLLRIYLTDRRRWYQRPRWHVWHWKLQIHPLQAFKRLVWSRCARCGGGFAWGESVTTSQWDSKGPSWFKGEPGVYHNGCA